MKWYSGEIAEAITVSKVKGAIFVVYLEGTDEKSKIITELIENGVLGKSLEKEHFVAIKIESGSVPHQQFSEIFKEPSVPSIYFISKNGSVLDIITSLENVDINKRIETILAKGGIPPVLVTSSESLIQNEQASSSGVVCNNGVCQLPQKSSTDLKPEEPLKVESDETEVLTAEQKIQRAQELIEKKRELKEAEEKQNDILKEMERRKMGQNVQQMKRWQEDQELKQVMEEREKEKRENQIARERVLAQIAQDKAERQARLQPQVPPAEGSKPTTPPPAPKLNSNNTKLQFKLPDGSSKLQEFANGDTLQSVVTYIKDNLLLNHFKLSTTFPRREFSANDFSQTLLDLQLCPNAVILVLPLSNGTISTNPGGTFSTLIWSLFAPIFTLFGYLKNLIIGRNENSNRNKRPSQPEPTEATNPKRRVVRESTVVKRQGNVHRLTDRKDSDDEGNTWNGNSTQQM